MPALVASVGASFLSAYSLAVFFLYFFYFAFPFINLRLLTIGSFLRDSDSTESEDILGVSKRMGVFPGFRILGRRIGERDGGGVWEA